MNLKIQIDNLKSQFKIMNLNSLFLINISFGSPHFNQKLLLGGLILPKKIPLIHKNDISTLICGV